MGAIDMAGLVGERDIVLVTLDALRYDVAVGALAEGVTPHLAGLLPGGVWERRHSPGSFTYAAHHAFLAGFLPTPAAPGRHERLLAARFMGSETTGGKTAVFDAPDIVSGLRAEGYYTICIGGVGFFNPATPLGRVLPGLFDEAHWSEEMGVTSRRSTAVQVGVARERLGWVGAGRRAFMLLNVSATHQPNCIFVEGAEVDDVRTQMAALAYVDEQLAGLWAVLRERGAVVIICADHGTAYGEDGYWGHRLAHEVVWTVPFGVFLLG
ncbi:MAG TPA: STM4013/SEN3800 family hydrolase [Anaerolineae bacterium]|nr:STM4013/SEN3800 family hydrolase [Anaerolineae bacterium]